MGLPKGRTNNPKGKPIGATGKTTKELREFINSFISNNLDSIQNDFDSLTEPKERLMFIEKLFQYALPKYQSQSLEITHESKEYNLPPWMREDDSLKIA